MCRILVCGEYGSTFSPCCLGSSHVWPRCASVQLHEWVFTHTERAHTGRKWVRGRLVGGDHARSVAQLNSSVRAALVVSVCSCVVLPIREVIIYQHLRHESRHVRSRILIDQQRCQSAIACLFGTDCGISKLSCRCVWYKWSACIPLNRKHSRLERCHAESRQSGVY